MVVVSSASPGIPTESNCTYSLLSLFAEVVDLSLEIVLESLLLNGAMEGRLEAVRVGSSVAWPCGIAVRY
jgi:hypothetical protein